MRSRDRDHLLGPPRSRDSGGVPPRFGSQVVVGVLLVAVVGLGLAVAYLLGTTGSTPVDPPEARRPPPALQSPPVTVQPKAAPTESRPVKPALSLSPVTAADWKKLGMGCACAFSRSRRSKELFTAGGDDFAIWRPGGARKVCPLKEDQLQQLFDDEATIQCGSSRIVIRGYGETTPGFDGHSRRAKLTVYEGGEEIVLDGEWGCGC